MKLVLDLDSTLCDFMSPWMIWLKQKGISQEIHELHEVKTYDWVHKKYGEQVMGFFLDDPIEAYSQHIPPFPGAREFVEWCSQNYETEIVTHSSKSETEVAKTAWCREYLGFDNVKYFPNLHGKYFYLFDSILVDDYPYHAIMNTSRNNAPSIIFNFQKENGWSNLEDYQELIQKESPDLSKLEVVHDYRAAQKSILKFMESV